MPFQYPVETAQRRHAPRGYVEYQAYKPWLRDEFTFRCAYCLAREQWYPNGQAAFSVDHLEPTSTAPQLRTVYENLVYACLRCNSCKQDVWPVADPMADAYGVHLFVKDDGGIDPLTAEGERLIQVFRLDHPSLNNFRSRWLRLIRVLQRRAPHDPEARRILEQFLGFPEELPDLALLRPPDRNGKPEGVTSCYLALRRRNELPTCY